MRKDYVVLALYEVHNSTASLMVNGEIVAAAHEERFSRVKGDHGFPLKAAQFCLQKAGVIPADVTTVVYLNEKFGPDGVANILFKRAAAYKIDDWVFENEHYWRPKLIEKKTIPSMFEVMGGWDRVPEHYYDLKSLDMKAAPEVVASTFNEIRKDAVERLLGIPRDRVVFSPHYLCHHYHAYYSGVTRGKDVAIMHLEGDGGEYNCAVSQPTPEGLRIIGGSRQADIGRLYQWVTLLLGMKPYHHEYKLMGLAPYATEWEVQRSMKVLEKLFKVDEEQLAIVYNEKPRDLYFTFQDAFRGHRFDGIAGALQRLVENLLLTWSQAVLRKTGAKRLCYGGGVAMNVKANMLLSQLPGLEHLFVPLSPSDESNVFGASYWLTEKHFLKEGRDPETIPPLKSAYLGSEFTRADAEKAIAASDLKERFHVTEGMDEKRVAKLIAGGWTVATCRGRAEFGQRALGNRSILAHPSQPGIVDKINRQIKYRDFWMPFCPSMLVEDHKKYVENPKNLACEHMTTGLPVKREMQRELQGVIHSGDLSARPQIVRQEANPSYHRLISEFKSHTGLGVVLNTSFNLHGEPVVNSPADALSTFARSELDGVWIGEHLVSRQPVP
jgi:carbamoyltransferase